MACSDFEAVQVMEGYLGPSRTFETGGWKEQRKIAKREEWLPRVPREDGTRGSEAWRHTRPESEWIGILAVFGLKMLWLVSYHA